MNNPVVSPKSVIMYGADWCGDCRRSKALLDNLKVRYTYVDVVEVADGAAKVVAITGGNQSIPVIIFADGTHLVEPSDKSLREKLTSLAII